MFASRIRVHTESNSIACMASWGCFRLGTIPERKPGARAEARPRSRIVQTAGSDSTVMHPSLSRSLGTLIGLLIGAAGLFFACESQKSMNPPARDAGDTAAHSARAASSERQFRVEQGDEAFCVTALRYQDQTAESFYNYSGDAPSAGETKSNAYTSAGIEKNGVSALFLYEGPKGTSLVVLHGKADTSSSRGGQATFDFDGLPLAPAKWVVRDDGTVSSDFDSKRDDTPEWMWGRDKTDGGVWRGGLERAFRISIEPKVLTGIEHWQVLSGDASRPDRHDLDLDEEVTISSGCADVGVVPDDSRPDALNPKADTPTEDESDGRVARDARMEPTLTGTQSVTLAGGPEIGGQQGGSGGPGTGS